MQTITPQINLTFFSNHLYFTPDLCHRQSLPVIDCFLCVFHECFYVHPKVCSLKTKCVFRELFYVHQ